jgi:hypothetical protein
VVRAALLLLEPRHRRRLRRAIGGRDRWLPGIVAGAATATAISATIAATTVAAITTATTITPACVDAGGRSGRGRLRMRWAIPAITAAATPAPLARRLRAGRR